MLPLLRLAAAAAVATAWLSLLRRAGALWLGHLRRLFSRFGGCPCLFNPLPLALAPPSAVHKPDSSGPGSDPQGLLDGGGSSLSLGLGSAPGTATAASQRASAASSAGVAAAAAAAAEGEEAVRALGLSGLTAAEESSSLLDVSWGVVYACVLLFARLANAAALEGVAAAASTAACLLCLLSKLHSNPTHPYVS